MDWPVRMVRLVSEPQEAGLCCREDGLTLAGVPLLEETGHGFEPRLPAELQSIFDAAYGAGSGVGANALLPGLRSVARALSKGDASLAVIGSLLMKLPDLDEAGAQRLQLAKGALKANFDPSQARDNDGRWTAEAGGRASRMTPPLGFFPDDSAVAIGEAATTGAEGGGGAAALRAAARLAARIAARVAGPVAFAASLLIPSNRSNIHEGQVPGRPDIHYRSDEGIVTLWRFGADGKMQALYRGIPDADGLYRDDQGRIVGREIGVGIEFNTDMLPLFEGLPDRDRQAPADTAPSTETSAETKDDEPRICPLPTVENINGRSARTIAYQSQITGLLPMFDMEYNGVRFDGCDPITGRMLEAKGLGFRDWAIKKPYEDVIKEDFYPEMIKQARKQNAAAAGRGVDWHFADPGMATFFEREFKKNHFDNIRVYYTEPIVKKVEDCLAWVRHMLLAVSSSQMDIVTMQKLFLQTREARL